MKMSYKFIGAALIALLLFALGGITYSYISPPNKNVITKSVSFEPIN